MIKVEEFILRRNKLVKKLEDNSIALIFASVPKKSSEDEDFPFVVNRNFYYLTNVKQDSSVLLIKKSGGLISETLFVHEYNETIEKWTGKRLTAKEAFNLSGVENVLYLNQLECELESIFKSGIYFFCFRRVD